MTLKEIHTISREMSIYEIERLHMMLKGIHVILKGMSLHKLKGVHLSQPGQPAKTAYMSGGPNMFILYGIRAAVGLHPLEI